MIGGLNERVILQGFTLISDGAGGQTKLWENLASVPTVWAKVGGKTAGEKLEEGRTTAIGTYMFTIRERIDIDETMRIVWRSENYNIRAVHRQGARPQYMLVEAERGV